ncbi:uncharacterized protein F5891DRAFT_944949 [Suillus fuscotomentosus]|uniref:Uncharacterized protein n=1 Tax=Suillus fuscotomentosus TaxID=1912939 RepID=A0AAD4EEQ1_9AGAM|nr:uncharacterized protein F5891DRAFT_944949 [Suillus fuscotomentosus]KAG1904791.1 hypothetical protein F5891DRAFT_944949 [Suillus fuscotomentosus]
MTERIVGRPWTAQEDRLLANAVAIHGESDNWKAVAHCVPERSNKACRKASRWLHSLSPNVKKTAWTPEEDHLLLELYEVYSTKWSVIARHIPGRTDDACSKRYREALDPSLRRDEWSKEEDDRLFDAYSRLPGRWGQVGQELQRSGLACRNRWRLLERKRNNLTEPQGVAVSKLSSTMSSEPTSPMLTYPDPTPWPPPLMLNPRQYWGQNLSQLGGGASPASGQQHSHVRSHNDVGLLGSVEPSVSHSQSIQHVVNLPPPFHYSSSSLSSALSSPHTLATRYEKSIAAPSGPYQTGEVHAAPHPITSAPPADNASAVFDYGVVLDPSIVNATRTTDYTVGHRPVYEDHVAQYNEIQRSVAPTPVPSHIPVPPQRASEYYSPAPHHNECHHQLIRDGETSPSQLSRDSRYPTTSQGPSAALVPTALGLPHEANDSYYVAHRQQLEHVQHVVMSSPDSSSVCSVSHDPSIKPYACGHESCWPVAATSSIACYTTSRGLSDHNKSSHPEDSGGERPYRCGLDGCGKSWKARYFGPESINGLQYHLQISKAHFQHAIVSTFVTSYIDGLAVPYVEASPGESDGKTKKQYSCPHQGCPNRYKQLSGLRYHLTHGHPTDLPVQLDLVPPALSRKLAEKMRKDGTSSQSFETHTHTPVPVPAPSQSCSPGHVSA